jgi:hypothetical protein
VENEMKRKNRRWKDKNEGKRRGRKCIEIK